WIDPHLSRSPNTNVPPAAQAEILTALYRRLGLTRVRDVLDEGIELQRGGPFNFSGKLTDAHVAFVKQAQKYGLRTFFPGPVYLEEWMQPDDPSGYVDYAMGVLNRWRQLGLEPPYYAPINEPQVSHNYPPQWRHDVVLQLGERLRAAGFKTKLVIPDDENPVDAYRRAVAVLSDPAARKYVGAVAFHIYGGTPADWVKLRQLASKYGLPLWMTEYNNDKITDFASALDDWGVKIHDLLTIGNVNAVDYLFGFFGNWVGENDYISIRFDSNGQYQGFSYSPLYWVTGQYSRFIRPGDVRVSNSPSNGAVLTSAFTGRGQVTVVAVNPGGNHETLRVRVQGGKVGTRAQVVRSSATENWKSLPTVRVRSGSFSTVIPPQSIVTFVLRKQA